MKNRDQRPTVNHGRGMVLINEEEKFFCLGMGESWQGSVTEHGTTRKLTVEGWEASEGTEKSNEGD
jgi:hypothetical protein